jgi:DNA-binding protein H-NS
MARRRTVAGRSRAELTARRRRTERLDAKKRKVALGRLRKEMVQLARSHGFSLDDLFGRGGKAKGNGSVAVKYRDSKNPGSTWTGRGRMPRWLVEAIKAGRNREDFLV